jgi:hypothetical protein
MMRRALVFLLAVSCVALTACGDDTTTPTTPTQPGTNTLTIIGQTDFMLIGSVVTLQATRSATTSSVVAADWSSSDGRIAAIDRQGRLTAQASGTTTVRAVFENLSASFEVRVAPSYAGTWEGPARVVSCTNPTPTVCTGAYAPGTQFVTRVTLVQNRDQVVGTLYSPYPAVLPTIPPTIPPLVVDATLSGRIEIGGPLPMTGTLVGPTPTAPAVGTISNWRVVIDATQPILRGSYTEVTTATGTSGSASVAWEFVGLTRLAS